MAVAARLSRRRLPKINVSRPASAVMLERRREEELDEVRLVLTPWQKGLGGARRLSSHRWRNWLVCPGTRVVPRLGMQDGIWVSTRMCGRDGNRTGAIGQQL